MQLVKRSLPGLHANMPDVNKYGEIMYARLVYILSCFSLGKTQNETRKICYS